MIHQFDRKKRVLFFPTSWANSVASWCAGVCSPTGTVRIKNTLTPKEGGVSLEIDINEERIASLALQAVENRTQFSDTERNLIKGMFQGATDQKILVYRNDLFGIDMEALRRNLGLDEEGEGKLQENQTDPSTAGKAYDISTDALLAEKAPKECVAIVYSQMSDGVETDASKISRIGTSQRAAREDHSHPFEHATGANTNLKEVNTSGGESTPVAGWPLDDNGWTRDETGTLNSSGSQTSSEFNGIELTVISRIVRKGTEDMLYWRKVTFDKNGCLYDVSPEQGVFFVLNENA